MVFHEKPISSTKISERTKVLKKSKSFPPQLNDPKRRANGSSVGTLKSRIKELRPICKSRKKYEKDTPASKQLAKEDAEFDWVFNKTGEVINPEDCLWLSSESLSPLYNVGDYSIDERLISLLSSWVFNFLDPAETTIDCLINLEGEDSKLIPNVESENENLESDFPSPSYKMNSLTDVNVSSSELSCEILSGSVDLDEMSFDEPLMWPFGDSLHWSSTLELFCQSPRRGLGSAFLLKNDGKKRRHKEMWKRRIVVASGLGASKIIEFKRGSRRVAIATKNTKSNHSRVNGSAVNLSKVMPSGLTPKKQKLMSAKKLRTMSMVGLDEINWRAFGSCSSSMDFDATGWSVSLINLNGEDSEWISTEMEEGLNSNFPSPSYKNQEKQGSSSTDADDIDQMDGDEPLFWPYEKDQNWSVALENFNVSPRKGNVLRSRSSIRVRMHDQRGGLRRGLVGLNASKIVGFKRVNVKKKGKGGKSRFGRASGRRNLVGEKMDVIMENGDDEMMLGVGEFDGHEGIDMEFQIHNFSILEE